MGKVGIVKKIIKNFEVFKQESDGTCGAASLKMLLNFHDIGLEEKYIVKTLFRVRPKNGVRPRTIVRAVKKLAQKYNFVFLTNEDCKIKDIERFIKKGLPVMVEWKGTCRCGIPGNVGHYSIVVGLDNDFIYLADPDNESPYINKVTLSDFKAAWYDCEDELPLRSAEWTYQWMLVIIFNKKPRD